eukprot:4847839-Lingulodinium_polyedra.AAC.1
MTATRVSRGDGGPAASLRNDRLARYTRCNACGRGRCKTRTLQPLAADRLRPYTNARGAGGPTRGCQARRIGGNCTPPLRGGGNCPCHSVGRGRPAGQTARRG